MNWCARLFQLVLRKSYIIQKVLVQKEQYNLQLSKSKDVMANLPNMASMYTFWNKYIVHICICMV